MLCHDVYVRFLYQSTIQSIEVSDGAESWNEAIRTNLYFSFKYRQGIDLHDSRLPMLPMRLTLMRRLVELAKSTPISIEEKDMIQNGRRD
jgi:hypothetical protein